MVERRKGALVDILTPPVYQRTNSFGQEPLELELQRAVTAERGESANGLGGGDSAGFGFDGGGGVLRLPEVQLEPVDQRDDNRDVRGAHDHDEEMVQNENYPFYDDDGMAEGSDRGSDFHHDGTHSPGLDSEPEVAPVLVEYHHQITGPYIRPESLFFGMH